ncbi:MAG: hypothetical protein ACI4SG_05600 [Oligosphaeraceae bacterium]
MPCLALARQANRRLLVLADPGHQSLADAVASRPGFPELSHAAGVLLAVLHEHGLFLPNADAGRFVLNEHCPWIPSPVLLADADGLRHLPGKSRRQRGRNLGQLLASLRQSESISQVLQGYQTAAGLDEDQMRQLWDETAR